MKINNGIYSLYQYLAPVNENFTTCTKLSCKAYTQITCTPSFCIVNGTCLKAVVINNEMDLFH